MAAKKGRAIVATLFLFGLLFTVFMFRPYIIAFTLVECTAGYAREQQYV